MASSSRNIGKMKPKIKPPRKHGTDAPIAQIWQELALNIREIQNNNAANLSFERNYRLAYNMCLHDSMKLLHDGLKTLVGEHLDRLAEKHLIPAFPSSSNDIINYNQQAEMLLKALKYVWDDHRDSMIKLSQILQYMVCISIRSFFIMRRPPQDRTKPENMLSTLEVGQSLFLEHTIRPPIQSHIVDAILCQVKYERDGYMINRSSVKGCVDVLLFLDVDGRSVYQRDLEPAFLEQSKAFYEAEGDKLLETCDSSEFLWRAKSRLQEEDSRIHLYMWRQTGPALRQILDDYLLTKHLAAVISSPSGLDHMIDGEKYDDLDRLYRMFVKVPAGIPTIKRSMRDSIARRGAEVNQGSFEKDEDAPVEDVKPAKRRGKKRAVAAVETLNLALKWVKNVLDLKGKLDVIWRNSFNKDRDIESAMNEAFSTFINKNEKAPEFISLFIDDILKRGLKGKTDVEVDAELDKTITVFRYITDKDIFERYYKGHLGKRLLHSRSVSDDAERGMLAKLKVECGSQFTQKMEGMFNDMRVSVDTMDAYKKHLSTHPDPPSIDLSVIVMTSTFWPMSHVASPCNLPEELLPAIQSFERFYFSRHSGRRLTWQPVLGNAEVRARFRTRSHDLNVSTLALTILMLFKDLEEAQTLTYVEIRDATQIVEQELQRNLQSLACAKFQILKKHPSGRDVSAEDSFSYNMDFSSPLQKIKISTIAAKVESGEERKETLDRVDEERRHQTEACIVRIMKDRKHGTHNDLVNEVTRQMAGRFEPNPLDIKKRIEGLIEVRKSSYRP
ncbi:Cullin-domain-containing protein [Fistulina hepatica ATCC 64428]|nr:Cullin-domain-containing protein [Fistulina hepatica ATCC 64428]